MKKLFESGMAFMIVALLCFVAAIVSQNGALFVSVGGFWLIMAIIVRSKSVKNQSKDKDDTAT